MKIGKHIAVTLFLITITYLPTKIYASENPAVFVTKEAFPPCYIKMSKIPGFNYIVNQPIPPINVRSFVHILIGNCDLLITAAGLPEGVILRNAGGTSTIEGTPMKTGLFIVMITAQARNNAASATFPMAVGTGR